MIYKLLHRYNSPYLHIGEDERLDIELMATVNPVGDLVNLLRFYTIVLSRELNNLFFTQFILYPVSPFTLYCSLTRK